MRLTRTSALVTATVLAGTGLLSACGGSTTSSTTSAAAPSSSASSAARSSAASPTTAAGGTASSAAMAKVNANTASKDDIAKALEAAGVKNSAKMADEIEEYRPYTAGDLKTKLSKELAKYGVGTEQLAKVFSVLTV